MLNPYILKLKHVGYHKKALLYNKDNSCHKSFKRFNLTFEVTSLTSSGNDLLAKVTHHTDSAEVTNF